MDGNFSLWPLCRVTMAYPNRSIVLRKMFQDISSDLSESLPCSILNLKRLLTLFGASYIVTKLLIAYFSRLDWRVSIVSPCLMLLSGDFSNVTP